MLRGSVDRRFAVPLVAMLSLSVSAISQTELPLTPGDGALLEPKLTQITSSPGQPVHSTDPVVLYEREINAYLRFQAASQLPAGVTDPYLSLGDAGYVSAQADVDLGVVSASRPRSALDPFSYLSGVVPVAASGVLETENGQGRLAIDAVTVGGIPVPLSVLHELIRYYSQSERQPGGVDLSRPFTLPYEVLEVRIDRGQAAVVQ